LDFGPWTLEICKGIWKLGPKLSQFAMTLDFDLSNLDPLSTIKCFQDSHPSCKMKTGKLKIKIGNLKKNVV
jgi:hypothetical protein